MPLLLDTLKLTCTLSSDNTGNQLIKNQEKKHTKGSQKQKTILQKKAYRKHKTIEHILPLIDLHSDLEKRYWDTYHCCEVIEQQGQYITAHYCSNRWCFNCSAIITEKLIQAYKPLIKEFQNPKFVTLTIPNVTKPELSDAIKKMIKTFNTINHKFRQNRPYRIVGIRKIEVEPSVHRGEYHPHFHIILESDCVARALVLEWLKSNPTADKRGQNITDCSQGSLAEFFKYTTKPAVKTKNPRKKHNHRTAYQYDTIYRALDKKRIFQPIGIKKVHPKENIEGIVSQKIPDLRSLPFDETQLWYWNQYEKDWLNIAGFHLSEFRMNKEMPGYVPVPGYCRRN